MKLLLITAIKEFESEIKNILVKSGVKSFTYSTVKGFKMTLKATSSIIGLLLHIQKQTRYYSLFLYRKKIRL